MDPADAAALRRVHEETGQAFTWWTARGLFATSEELRQFLQAIGDADVQLAAAPSRMPGDVVKAMVYGTRAELDAAEPAPPARRLTPRVRHFGSAKHPFRRLSIRLGATDDRHLRLRLATPRPCLPRGAPNSAPKSRWSS
jgi:hypothetical protein